MSRPPAGGPGGPGAPRVPGSPGAEGPEPPAIPANLIINADDFGIHPRVSLAIARCLDEGLINSFSVLPCADAFHRDLLRDILARHPGVKVGAHLTVLDAGGLAEHPWHFLEFLAGYCLGRHPVSAIRARWDAQVRQLGESLGGTERIAHLDGHQHLHVLPGLWEAARGIQEKYRIPRLRVPYESLARAVLHKFPFGLALQAAARLRGGPDARRLIGFFTSTRFTVAGNLPGLREVLRRPDREFELMVHPALPGEVPEAGPAGPPGGYGSPVPGQVGEMEELRKLRDMLGSARL